MKKSIYVIIIIVCAVFSVAAITYAGISVYRSNPQKKINISDIDKAYIWEGAEDNSNTMELTKAQIYEFVETFNASDSWQPLSAESVPNFGIIVNFKSGTQLRVNEIASNISVRIGRTILGQYVEYELQSPDMCAFIIRLVTEMCGAE